MAVTDPHSGEAPGTVLADNFTNKQEKPDPGEAVELGHNRGEKTCAQQAIRGSLPCCERI